MWRSRRCGSEDDGLAEGGDLKKMSRRNRKLGSTHIMARKIERATKKI
jgi:hypothetical protein